MRQMVLPSNNRSDSSPNILTIDQIGAISEAAPTTFATSRDFQSFTNKAGGVDLIGYIRLSETITTTSSLKNMVVVFKDADAFLHSDSQSGTLFAFEFVDELTIDLTALTWNNQNDFNYTADSPAPISLVTSITGGNSPEVDLTNESIGLHKVLSVKTFNAFRLFPTLGAGTIHNYFFRDKSSAGIEAAKIVLL